MYSKAIYAYLASIWNTTGYNVTVRGHNLTGLTALWMALNNRCLMRAVEFELKFMEISTRAINWRKYQRRKQKNAKH